MLGPLAVLLTSCPVRALTSVSLLCALWQLRGLIKHQSPLLSRVRRRRRYCLCCAFLWRQFMRLSVAVMDPLSSDGKGLFSDGSPIRRVESAAPSSRGSRSSDYFQEGSSSARERSTSGGHRLMGLVSAYVGTGRRASGSGDGGSTASLVAMAFRSIMRPGRPLSQIVEHNESSSYYSKGRGSTSVSCSVSEGGDCEQGERGGTGGAGGEAAGEHSSEPYRVARVSGMVALVPTSLPLSSPPMSPIATQGDGTGARPRPMA